MDNTKHSWVQNISLTPPSLGNNTADSDRLADLLKKRLKTPFVEIGLELLIKIPFLLRQWNYRARCVLIKDGDRWVVTGLLDPGGTDRACGMAVDLGTTRIAIRLLDLASGELLGETSFDNPQISIGPDVLTRIHHADTDGGLLELNRLVIESLNDNFAELCRESDILTDNIYIVSLAGNTVMTHLFLGITPRWVIREPYIPAVNCPIIFRGKDLGLSNATSGKVFVFPNIGSYFGGDLIAGILYSGMNRSSDISILVDVGTNAEVVLGNSSWLVGCAGAAGPALEGGVTRMGMNAGTGVIDRVLISDGEVDIHTIGDATPRGICGSGLIDLAAQLFLSEMIDIRGKFVVGSCGDLLVYIDDMAHFILVPGANSATGEDLTLSQSDLDSLVRSKAAMYTILRTITGTVGISPNDLGTFHIAGTFGSFINPESAISIGMIPDLPLSSYRTLGNSSLEGASMMLSSSEYMDEIQMIRNNITYLELNVNQEFMNAFSGAKFIPHTDRSLFPSVK